MSLRAAPIGKIIQPLTKEIHLFDTFVAGTTHLLDPSVLETIQVGGRLTHLQEDNKFDSNAVMILTEEKKEAGLHPGKR